MSKKSDELMKLTEIWYQKLKESGFKDIEQLDKSNEYRLKEWDSCYFHLRNDPDIFDIKREYYYQANQFLHSYSFKSETDRHAWQLHSEGVGFREIAKSLRSKGTRTNKDIVATVIRRLKRAMKEAK